MIPTDPVAWAVKAFHDGRNLDYALYQSYIDGDHPTHFTSERIRTVIGGILDGLVYNRCHAVVDAHADRMQINGFGADDESVSQRAEDLWNANRMDLREGHIEVDALGLGDSYLIAEKHPRLNKVHLWVNAPQNVRVHYAEDVPDALDLAAKTWLNEDRYQRLNLYFEDRIEKYISRQRALSGMPNTPLAFEQYDRGDDAEPWTFALNVKGRVPVFPFANNGRTNAYGVSELRPVLPLQSVLNHTLRNQNVAVEFGAFPQKAIIGVDAQSPDEQNELKRFASGVSTILTLFGPDAKIDEFSAVNIAQYLAVAEFYDTAIARVSKVPVHYLSMTGGIPSGRALRIAEAPFTRKIEDRQKAFGASFGDAMTYALQLDGMTNVQLGDLRINWVSAAPITEEDQLDNAILKQQIGYPFQTILRENGYEPDQIELIMQEKKAAVDEAMREFNRGPGAVPLVAGRIGDDEDEAA